MIRRHAWKLFIVIAITGLVPAFVLWFAPDTAPTIMRQFGHEVPDAVAQTEFFHFLTRWIATVLLGGNLITLMLAPTALRQGQRWAWYAMWYWPIMFATHLAIYDGTARISQAAWLLLTVIALMAMRPDRQPVSDAKDGVSRITT